MTETQFPFNQSVVWRPTEDYLHAECQGDAPCDRAAYLGEPPGDLSALVNPEAVNGIRRAASLE